MIYFHGCWDVCWNNPLRILNFHCISQGVYWIQIQKFSECNTFMNKVYLCNNWYICWFLFLQLVCLVLNCFVSIVIEYKGAEGCGGRWLNCKKSMLNLLGQGGPFGARCVGGPRAVTPRSTLDVYCCCLRLLRSIYLCAVYAGAWRHRSPPTLRGSPRVFDFNHNG